MLTDWTDERSERVFAKLKAAGEAASAARSSRESGSGSDRFDWEDTTMRRMLLLLLAVGVVTFTFSVPALAHEGHDHKIMGTVTMAAADHVMLRDRDGKDVAVKITKATKVKSKPALKVDEIKAGTRIVITAAQEKDKSFTAKSIEVAAASAAVTK